VVAEQQSLLAEMPTVIQAAHYQMPQAAEGRALLEMEQVVQEALVLVLVEDLEGVVSITQGPVDLILQLTVQEQHMAGLEVADIMELVQTKVDAEALEIMAEMLAIHQSPVQIIVIQPRVKVETEPAA
jgi:hypothetical protein